MTCCDKMKIIETPQGRRCESCRMFECCRDDNFYTRVEDQPKDDHGRTRDDVTVFRCKTCDRRHIRAVADPGQYVASIAGLK